MAAITVRALKVELRDRLDEQTPRRWNDGQLTRWINEGARDIARRAECLQSVTDVVIAANEQTKSLSSLSGLLRIHRVEWQTTGSTQWNALEPRDINGMDAVWWDHQATHKNRPNYFTLKGTPPALSIIFYPTTPTGGTARVWWWRLPTEALIDTATLDLPDGWHDVALDYAEYRALRKDADPRWKESFEIYKDNLASLIEQTRRYNDQNATITPEVPHLPSWIYDDSWGY